MKIFRKKAGMIFILLLGLLFAAPSGTMAQKDYDPNETFKKMLAAMQYIRMYYVDSVNEPELVEDAIIEMLKELDPHSTYISRENLQKANEPIEGSFEGIGVTFQIYKDTILVIAPVPGGPSDKLGIMAGDKIVKIEGEDATGDDINNQYVMDRLRGKKGTEVDVAIYRPSRKKLIDFTIVRDEIPLNSVDASFIAAPGIGYIKLNRFSKTTGDEIAESIIDLKGKGMEKLILDLRGNPGGLMFPAIEISDMFLDDDKLIVYTKGLRSYPREFFATEEGLFQDGEMVVMINEGSASASEIVSGAVQDWDRGVILGRRSFGKGLVQQPFRLPDSSFMRLTTAKYYTPNWQMYPAPLQRR
ncbi:MAG: S41 family peptidase [Bacteroidota bacterium]|nr:S41 family peptidase [Bacteroidota bacterium]